MKKLDFVNPFNQKGRIVTGEAFIGRRHSLLNVYRNVTDLPIPNNLAIIGYPRIGKSSLAKQSIICQKEELLNYNKIPIWLEFSTFSSRESFFRYLVRYSLDTMVHAKLADDTIIDCAKQVVSYNKDWDDLKYDVCKYFEVVRSKGYFTIFILDEFDEARHKFKNNMEAFKQLRDLGYDGDRYGVAFVTTSRRSIKEIETQSNCSSTLDGIFNKEYLKMYDTNEMNEYYSHYSKVGLHLSDAQKLKIEYYCGGHPFLLANIGFEIIEHYKQGQLDINIDLVFEKIRLSFLNYYEHLIGLLKEDNTYEKMLQILFGPMLSVTDDDVIELRDIYGLLKDDNLPSKDQGLIAFSGHFQDHLSNLGRKIEFWPLWTSLETTLRDLIAKVFVKKHSENWLAKLLEMFPVFFNGTEIDGRVFEGAIQKRAKSKEDYRSDNLLDYLDAQPLFEIILSKNGWNNYFRDIFGGDKNKIVLQKKIELIVKIRNPYAHSRFRSIKPETVQQAEIYCKEILEQANNILDNTQF